jgi:hypothetical protein
MSPGRGGPLRSRRMSLTRFRLDVPPGRCFCRVPAHMRGGRENDRSGSRYRRCRARIGAGRLVRSAVGRLLSRGLRWCWFPIGKLRRSCIRYDRCRRRIVCGQPWIGKLAGLKQVVKAECEEAAYDGCGICLDMSGKKSIPLSRRGIAEKPSSPDMEPLHRAVPRWTYTEIFQIRSPASSSPKPLYIPCR